MATYTVFDSSLTSVADAIRAKAGTSSSITFPDGFVNSINNIKTTPVLQSKTATENGVITADSGYDGLSSVTVNVPNNGVPLGIAVAPFSIASLGLSWSSSAEEGSTA